MSRPHDGRAGLGQINQLLDGLKDALTSVSGEEDLTDGIEFDEPAEE